MPDKKKCGNPIWCSKQVQGRVRTRAKASHRTMGNEVAAMLDELDGRIVPMNVPVLQGEKKPEDDYRDSADFAALEYCRGNREPEEEGK